MSIPGKAYQRRVDRSLALALENARAQSTPFNLEQDRWIIFSDHHKGVRDGADDFLASELSYHGALGYYFELGYNLVVLGDVEELWENHRNPVIANYHTTLQLERQFHQEGHYRRVWGNHDDDWRFPGVVRDHLGPIFGDLDVQEGFTLTVQRGGQELGMILLVHGHQGTLESDIYGWFSRYPIRYIWRPLQRLFNIRVNSPSQDWGLRKKHNIALFNWAVKQENLLLIAGHTHHPVFDINLQLAKLHRELEHAREIGDLKLIAQKRAELEQARVRQNRLGFRMSQPRYFNSGCCCFPDGDITGIELAEGKIRLVQWVNDLGQTEPLLLAEADLEEVFAQVSVSGPAAYLLPDPP
jgi:hypothetical protein